MGRRGLASPFVLLSLTLSAGCSLILDFDDPPAPPDAMQADAIPTGACELGEPNEMRSEATVLEAATATQGGICEVGDHDFYSITVAADQTVTVEAAFTQDAAKGDLDLRLYDVAGNVVGRSASADSDERIVCPGASPPCSQLVAGNYFVEVYGFQDQMVNGYAITLTLE